MSLSFILSILLGGVVRIALGLSGQKWARTFHVTAALLLLPVVSFTVSEFISGDIALSLGMVGALSIVRFRNPVKSPLELVTYFALITIGIGISVDSWLSIQLCLVFSFVLILLSIILKLGNSYGRNFFTSSFSEGSEVIFLEISLDKPIESGLLKDHFLQEMFNSTNSGVYSYRLTFEKYQEAIDFVDLLSSIAKVNDYNIIQN